VHQPVVEFYLFTQFDIHMLNSSDIDLCIHGYFWEIKNRI